MAEKPALAQSPYLHLDAGYTQAMDYDANGNEIYHGWAVPKTADKTAAVWRICKEIYTLGNGSAGVSGVWYLTDVRWANGDEQFKNIWNNRASLSFT